MMPNLLSLTPIAVGAILTSACTISPDANGLSVFQAKDSGLVAGTTVTLTQPLQVKADTARAFFPDASVSAAGVSCYVEVNTVRAADAPPVTVQPGTFSVVWSRDSSSPIGALNRADRWGFNDNSPSFVEMIHTVRLNPDADSDVRALKCRQTFTDLHRAVYPTTANLRDAAGAALTF